MKTRTQIWFSILTAMILVLGCGSDKERAATTAMSFAQATEIYNAPFRAYAFLSADDKAFMTAEEYSATFPASARAPEGILTEKAAKIETGQAVVEVELVDAAGEASTLKYVLSKEGDKWRIRLDLERLQKLGVAIKEIKAAVEQGDLKTARAKLVDARARPFLASNANELLADFAVVEAELEEAERGSHLLRDLKEAKVFKGEDLKSNIKELEPRVTPKDREAATLLEELKSQLALEEKNTMLSKLPIPSGRVRRVRRGPNLVREATIQYVNPLQVGLSAASLEVSFLNGPDTEPIEARVVSLPLSGTLQPGSTTAIVFSLEPSPEGWTGKTISLSHKDITLATE